MKPDLDAIRARCEAATPGPWRVDGSTYDEDCNEHLAPYGLEGPNERLIWSSGGGEYSHPDMATAQFIANARTDIPALLAYIDELESCTAHTTSWTIGETEWAQRIATLEHMLAEERENVDTLRREIDKAQAAFDYGCGQDGPDGWKPGETAIDALVRAKRERERLREELESIATAMYFDWRGARGSLANEVRAQLGRAGNAYMTWELRALRAERERDELLRVNKGAAQHGIITDAVRELTELLGIQRQNPTANETVDAAATEIEALRTTVEELKARIAVLEAMRP